MAKDSKGNDFDIIFPFAILIIIAFFAFLLLSNLTKVVPSKKYVNGLISYARQGEENFKSVHYPYYLNSLQKAGNRIGVVTAKLRQMAKDIDSYGKKHHTSILVLLASSKKHPKYKKELMSFFADYWVFLKLRVEIIFYYLMSQIIIYEFEIIGFILAIFLFLALKTAMPVISMKLSGEKKMRNFLNLLFFAQDDALEIFEKHPVSGRYLPNVDRFRNFFDSIMFKNRSVKTYDAIKYFREKGDTEAEKMLRCAGTVLLYMSQAVCEKDGKIFLLKKEGYPASIMGSHNPHKKYGLLMHSVMVAYTATRIASLEGVTDARELLNVFFAGLVHDAGKVRLYKKVISKPSVVDSPDAIEGDKYIREAKQAKVTTKWKSLVGSQSSFEKEEISQMKILISKTKYRVFPDENIIQQFIKPADHICVDAELRYAGVDEKERKKFFKYHLKRFFERNNIFNSFDRDMVGFVFSNKQDSGKRIGVILATLSARLIDSITENFKEKKRDINIYRLYYPLRKMASGYTRGGKLRPFSYTISQYLYESGYLFLSDELPADNVGLYDILVKSTYNGTGTKTPYNACWLIDDFDGFCKEYDINPDIKQEVELVEVYQREGQMSDPLKPEKNFYEEITAGDISIFKQSNGSVTEISDDDLELEEEVYGESREPESVTAVNEDEEDIVINDTEAEIKNETESQEILVADKDAVGGAAGDGLRNEEKKKDYPESEYGGVAGDGLLEQKKGEATLLEEHGGVAGDGLQQEKKEERLSCQEKGSYKEKKDGEQNQSSSNSKRGGAGRFGKIDENIYSNIESKEIDILKKSKTAQNSKKEGVNSAISLQNSGKEADAEAKKDGGADGDGLRNEEKKKDYPEQGEGGNKGDAVRQEREAQGSQSKKAKASRATEVDNIMEEMGFFKKER